MLAPIVDGAIAVDEYEFTETSQNGVAFHFDADTDNFYFGATGVDLGIDNIHIAFLNSDGSTSAGKFGVDFATASWTHGVSLFGVNDVCYYAFDDPHACQQQGAGFDHFAGFAGEPTSEIAIPRNFLGSNATSDSFQVSAWAANNVGDFVFASSPSSNPIGSAEVSWQAHHHLPLPTTSIEIAGTVLEINDIRAATSDTITIAADNANGQLVITDPNQILTTSISGASGNGTNSIVVPLGEFTSINVNTGGGDDTVTIDFSGGNFAVPLSIDGGVPAAGHNDRLVVAGGGFPNATFIFDNQTDGSIQLTGTAAINYTGLESISAEAISADNVSLRYSTASETIAVTNVGSGATSVVSTAGTSVEFADPADTLTINAGDVGDDLVAINSLELDYPANVIVSGGSGSDSVSLNAEIGLAAGKALTIDSEWIGSATDTITLVGGAFHLVNSNVIDDAATLLVNGATFELGSNSETVAQVQLINGMINGGGASLNGTRDFLVQHGTVNARLGGNVGLVKTTAGTVMLGAANLFTGGVALREGTLEITHDAALGSGDVTINDASAGAGDTSLFGAIGGLRIANNIEVAGEGTGTTTIGTIGGGAASEFTGAVTLNRPTTIHAEHVTRFRGVISGTPGAIGVEGGGQTDWLTNNTFTGDVILADDGTTLQVGIGVGANQIPDTSIVTVGSGSTFRTSFSHLGDHESIGGLNGSGTVTTHPNQAGTSILTIGTGGTTSTFAGMIVDGDADSLVALTKIGSGSLTLSGASTYSGETVVSTGALLIDGSITSPVFVSGGLLGGGGTIDATISMGSGGGAIAPSANAGTTPGQLLVNGSVALHQAGRLEIDLGGTVAGSQYDQLRVIGTGSVVDLAGADLRLSLGFVPTAGDTFTIIDNVDPSSTVTGTFDGLPNGATVSVDGNDFRIEYNGGDGNDVVLTKLSQPDTLVALDGGGNLTVTDSGSASNDTLVVSRNGSFYFVRDNDHVLFATQPEFTSINEHLIRIAVADVTGGQIRFNTGDGDDHLTINFATGQFEHDLVYDGGGQSTGGGDSLSVETGGDMLSLPLVVFAGADCLSPGCEFSAVPDQPIRWASIESISIDGRAFNAGELYVESNEAANRIVIDSPDGTTTGVRIDGRDFGSFPLLADQRVVVFAGDGNDYVAVDGTILPMVEFHGGSGNDHLVGNPTNDSLFGGAGNDVVIGGGGNDFLHGDSPASPMIGGNDLLEGGSGSDIAFGGAGNDTISTYGSEDTLAGGVGNDTLFGGEGNDFSYGGNDDGADFIADDLGDDVLFGGGGADQLFGDHGRDLVVGGIGTDTVDGGAGDDLLANGKASLEAAIDSALMLLATGDDTLFVANVLPAIDRWRTAFSADGFGSFDDDEAIDLMLGGNGADLFDVELIDDFSSLDPAEGDSQV